MAFPFHHHHRRDDDEDEGDYPPPRTRPFFSDQPPPPVRHNYDEPPPPTYHAHQTYDGPPPPTHHTHHDSYNSDYPPQPPFVDSDCPSEPPPPPPPPPTHHSHHPHFPAIVYDHSHHPDPSLPNRLTVKVYAKANPDYSLAIRHGKVVLVRSDPSDETQHWFKDEKYSTRVKDEEGSPSFALVNKATGQAMKHSIGVTHPVQLISYDPEVLDESILWTQSKEIKDGYRAIRMVNNVHLNVDAFHGDEYSGGVHDGTQIVLWKWKKGDNQLWKIVPYCKSSFSSTLSPFL